MPVPVCQRPSLMHRHSTAVTFKCAHDQQISGQ